MVSNRMRLGTISTYLDQFPFGDFPLFSHIVPGLEDSGLVEESLEVEAVSYGCRGMIGEY